MIEVDLRGESIGHILPPVLMVCVVVNRRLGSHKVAFNPPHRTLDVSQCHRSGSEHWRVRRHRRDACERDTAQEVDSCRSQCEGKRYLSGYPLLFVDHRGRLATDILSICNCLILTSFLLRMLFAHEVQPFDCNGECKISETGS